MVLILTSTSVPANAATSHVEFENYVTADVKNVVSFKKKGCGQVTFDFEISTDLEYPYHVLFAKLETGTGTLVGQWRFDPGRSPGDGTSTVAYTGISSVKACRTSWANGKGTKFAGVKNGTYYFRIAIVQMDPVVVETTNKVRVKIIG